jgi:hypothetical protein
MTAAVTPGELLELADSYDAKALSSQFPDRSLIYASVAKDIRRLAAKPSDEGLARDGWRTDLEDMPVNGRFEALQYRTEVFRHLHDSQWVIEPTTGRMFVPKAWRLSPSGEQKR